MRVDKWLLKTISVKENSESTMSSSEWENKTVVELKKACSERGLEQLGRKVDLVTRLNEYELLGDQGDQEGQEEEQEVGGQEVEDADAEEPALDYEDTNAEEENQEEDKEGEEEEMEQEEENDEEGDDKEQKNGEEGDDKEQKNGEEEEAGKEEEEEAGEEGEDGDKADEVKDEKPENQGKKLAYQPRQADFVNCQSTWQRLRTLVVGPLSHEESMMPAIQDLIQQAEKSEVSYLHTQDKSFKMWAKIHFYTLGEAKDALEQVKSAFPETKSMVMPKKPQSFHKSRSIFWLRDLVLGNQEVKEKDSLGTILVDNIPPSISSEADLMQHFPGAKEVFLAWTKEDTHLGYAFVTYQSKEKSKILVEGLKTKGIELDGCKLRVMAYSPGIRIQGGEKPRARQEKDKKSDSAKPGEEEVELKPDAQGNFTVMFERPNPEYTNKMAKEEFDKFGPVSDVNITRSGYVFIRYKQRSCANKALKDLGATYGLRPAAPGKRDSRIAQKRNRSGSPPRRGESAQKVSRRDRSPIWDELVRDANGNYTVFLKKPNSGFSKEQARRKFSEYGNVVDVHESRSGAMFVRYKDRHPAVRACKALGDKMGVKPAPPGKKELEQQKQQQQQRSRHEPQMGHGGRPNMGPGIMGMNPMMSQINVRSMGPNVPSLFDIDPMSNPGKNPAQGNMMNMMQIQQQQLQQQQLIKQQQQLLAQQQQQAPNDTQTASTVSLLMGISKMLGKLNKSQSSTSRSRSRSRSRSPPPAMPHSGHGSYSASKSHGGFSSQPQSSAQALLSGQNFPPSHEYRGNRDQYSGSSRGRDSSQFVDQSNYMDEDQAYRLYN